MPIIFSPAHPDYWIEVPAVLPKRFECAIPCPLPSLLSLLQAYVFPPEQLVPMIAQCDYVVLSTPYTPDTHQLINAAAIAAMKPNTVFINVGRGKCVDEEALVKGGCLILELSGTAAWLSGCLQQGRSVFSCVVCSFGAVQAEATVFSVAPCICCACHTCTTHAAHLPCRQADVTLTHCDCFCQPANHHRYLCCLLCRPQLYKLVQSRGLA